MTNLPFSFSHIYPEPLQHKTFLNHKILLHKLDCFRIKDSRNLGSEVDLKNVRKLT